MSQDKLERYIRDHREAFDDLEPGPGVWDRIGKRKSPVIRLNRKDIAWKAAAVAVIFTASWLLHDHMDARKEHKAEVTAAEMEQSPLVGELIEAEAYYSSVILQRKEEVFRLTAAYPEVRQEIDMEMNELDKVFDELKEDLRDNADNEEVLEAMIQNYRLKLDILEEMLYRIKQSHEHSKESDYENAAMEL